jgi:hypothetical protein
MVTTIDGPMIPVVALSTDQPNGLVISRPPFAHPATSSNSASNIPFSSCHCCITLHLMQPMHHCPNAVTKHPYPPDLLSASFPRAAHQPI